MTNHSTLCIKWAQISSLAKSRFNAVLADSN
nr:MAG TPA: hypothetical protein [Caudoviricetes sp.]